MQPTYDDNSSHTSGLLFYYLVKYFCQILQIIRFKSIVTQQYQIHWFLRKKTYEKILENPNLINCAIIKGPQSSMNIGPAVNDKFEQRIE